MLSAAHAKDGQLRVIMVYPRLEEARADKTANERQDNES